MKVVLIPAAGCEWRQAGRLLGRVELELTEAGGGQCDAWAAQLRDLGIETVYHGPDELSDTTARRIAKAIGASTRSADKLAEVDLGLWAGLTDAELKSRFAKAHRQLGEAPLTVQPPEGEAFGAAAERLEGFIRKALRRNGQKAVGFVLRPLALALVRRRLQREQMDDVYAAARAADEPVVVEPDEPPE